MELRLTAAEQEAALERVRLGTPRQLRSEVLPLLPARHRQAPCLTRLSHRRLADLTKRPMTGRVRQ